MWTRLTVVLSSAPEVVARLRRPDQSHPAGVGAGLQTGPPAAAALFGGGTSPLLLLPPHPSFMLLLLLLLQISRLCAEEAAAQEQTGQVEECLKVNLLKLHQDTCKKVPPAAPPGSASQGGVGPEGDAVLPVSAGGAEHAEGEQSGHLRGPGPPYGVRSGPQTPLCCHHPRPRAA